MTHLDLSFNLSLFLGFTFLLSAFGKLRDRRGFVIAVLTYEVLPPRAATVYGKVLPWVELGIGISLTLGVWQRVASVISLGVLASFMIAVALNIRRGRRIECHCFGTIDTHPIGGTTLVGLGLLMAASYWVLVSPPPSLWKTGLLMR